MKILFIILAALLLFPANGFGDIVGGPGHDDHGSHGDHNYNVTIANGQSGYSITPHHDDLGSGHNAHYFQATGDAHHFAWGAVTPSSAGNLTVKYDFRAQGGFTNFITTGQKARVIDSLNMWSAATNGKLLFVLDTGAALSDIINIGTGDLAALGFTSAPGGILGLGGGGATHGAINHTLHTRVAWQDFAETWDETIGNGNPGGTVDYFTVAAQEIGHALGLGHTTGVDIMNGSYTGELTGYSAVDFAHIQSVYGLNAVPEPGSLGLMIVASSMLMVVRRRRS